MECEEIDEWSKKTWEKNGLTTCTCMYQSSHHKADNWGILPRKTNVIDAWWPGKRQKMKKILNNCNPLSLIPRHWPKSLENESSCNYTNAGPFPSLSCTFFLNHEDFHACELESWIPTFLNFPPEKSSQNFQQSGEVGINFLIWSFRILPSHFLSLLLII